MLTGGFRLQSSVISAIHNSQSGHIKQDCFLSLRPPHKELMDFWLTHSWSSAQFGPSRFNRCFYHQPQHQLGFSRPLRVVVRAPLRFAYLAGMLLFSACWCSLPALIQPTQPVAPPDTQPVPPRVYTFKSASTALLLLREKCFYSTAFI